ncbi:MAG TPA: hypothetical protein PLK28_01700 [Candidatus Rifleibacterium sp.]|nr:hypothetical protein [Candidatus Rifleibacterium sp.]HNW11070.1 hypothetical protein [Candidatus Rifleibacterium sp.]HOI89203.1 hypothetical protein [Candidatus Rifleibacterium sp.]HPW59906.1 hypothetical protein [Candidatus Rifleibacterium sp.]
MKQTPELDLVQSKMQPGVLTLKGFLGSDDRKLADILVADQQSFSRLGITPLQAAERLQQLADLGADLMEEEILVEQRYRIKVRDDRGKIPSPWGDGLFEKGDVDLIDNSTGETLKWNRLTLRLMSVHGFCGGVDSEYRLDPEKLVRILDLKPEAQS